jgi:hypothetical protein
MSNTLIKETIQFVKDEATKFGAKTSDSNKSYVFRENISVDFFHASCNLLHFLVDYCCSAASFAIEAAAIHPLVQAF